jgi:RNA-directed DNA polymerase
MVRKAARVNQGDLPGQRDDSMDHGPAESARAGVRAPIVALKLRNGRGAKGAQEGGLVTASMREEKPAIVPQAKQVGETQDRWSWVEPSVWTARMLTALEQGVKGGQWFSLIDKVYRAANLASGFAQVKRNGGAAGVDQQTIAMYERDLAANQEKLARQLQDDSYHPAAVRRVWIDKAGTKAKRPLGIPVVRDRVAETALRNVLEPIFERDFAEQSYGFRPGRGAKQALRRVDQLLKAGYTQVVDADLQSYFDSIPHEPLLKRVQEKVSDGRIIRLLTLYLQQSVMEGMASWTPETGTPQGAVISPLLSNIYLDPLDHLVAAQGIEMVRYADDFVILCRSAAEAHAALQLVQQWTAEAGLTLHPEKTRVVDASVKGGFDFLGYHFERGYRWPRQKSIKKLREHLRRKTRRNNGHSLAVIIAEVNRTLTGWFEYFKHSHKTAFRNHDAWVRTRLRSILRRRLGMPGGAWNRPDYQRWPNAYFATQGVFSLALARQSLRQSAGR